MFSCSMLYLFGVPGRAVFFLGANVEVETRYGRKKLGRVEGEEAAVRMYCMS